ncbi:MAG: hypothetical protein WD512_11515 [Candidatus Paceibacterota bacterium]
MANLDRNVYEGWTPRAFIEELEPTLTMVQGGQSWQKPLQTKEELKAWCKDNQPYYKKHVPEVVNHFAKQYGLK